MKYSKRGILFLLLSLVTFSLSFQSPQAALAADKNAAKIQNVILLIGDGMGNSQISAGRYIGLGRGARLNMDQMPVIGLSMTYSASSMVTDSAAAATALACGVKTNNGTLGIDPQGASLPSILEIAKKSGYSGGLVTTCPITDATPAGFASHVLKRGEQATIAEQELTDNVDVLMGGGKEFFVPKEYPNSGRSDSKNLIEFAKQKGYTYAETADQLKAAKGSKILGLFQMSYMTTVLPEPPLEDLAVKAIQTLSANRKGFFLMVEGGQIDVKCHANDAANAIRQTVEFDKAVGKALDFAKKNGHTLVLVTADHETGGLALNLGKDNKSLEPAWTTNGHSGAQVLIFAYGPGSQKFAGLHNNVEIPRIIANVWGLKGLAAPEKD